MPMTRLIPLAAMTVALCLAAAGAPQAQTAKELVGTWTLVSNINTQADGTKSDGFGANPKGMAIFQPDGHFVTLITRPDLPKFASGNRNTGTADENKAIVQGTIGLFGTYTMEGKTLVLKTESSTWPGWAGTDQKRPITSFAADDLIWTVAATVGGNSELHWKRIK
jgi:hypothetical protein